MAPIAPTEIATWFCRTIPVPAVFATTVLNADAETLSILVLIFVIKSYMSSDVPSNAASSWPLMVMSPAANEIPVTVSEVIPDNAVLSVGSHENVPARRAETSTSATSEEASSVAAMPSDAVSTEPKPMRIVSPAWSPIWNRRLKVPSKMFCALNEVDSETRSISAFSC